MSGTPELLVKGSASPHTYAMKPSDAPRLNHADLFFRMSEAVEPFTAKVVQSLPKQVQVVTLQEHAGLQLLAAAHRRHIRGRTTTAMERSRPCPRRTTRWTVMPGSIPQRQGDGGPHRPGSERQGPGQRRTIQGQRRPPKAKLDASGRRTGARPRAGRRQALHRLPRRPAVLRTPLRPERRRLDLDEP